MRAQANAATGADGVQAALAQHPTLTATLYAGPDESASGQPHGISVLCRYGPG